MEVRMVNERLQKAVNLCMKLHTENAKKESKMVRGHDRTTPYWTHPVGMMTWIMEDNNNISFEDRYLLGVVALFHDILEDTNTTEDELKDALLEIFGDSEFVGRVIELVKACSINGGSKVEYEHLKQNESNIPDEVWYIKLVHKLFNLIGSKEYFVRKGSLDFYCGFLKFLANKVNASPKYGNSIFVELAYATINKMSK